jgi:sorbitol-specific phosphotransferase system component IIC
MNLINKDCGDIMNLLTSVFGLIVSLSTLTFNLVRTFGTNKNGSNIQVYSKSKITSYLKKCFIVFILLLR